MGGSSQQLELQRLGAKWPRGRWGLHCRRPPPLPPPPIPGSSLEARTQPNVCPAPSTVACKAPPGARAISEPLATVETARCHLWELWNENVVGSN